MRLYVISLVFIYLITASLCLLTTPSNSLSPQPHLWQPQIWSLFLWVWFVFVLDLTYEWHHTEFVFLCLTNFIWSPSILAQVAKFQFHLFMDEYYSIVFIYISIDGHWLFPCLGYINVVAVHICLPLSFRFWWS